MEGERGVSPNFELQVSFTNTPQAIHEMGFVQFEENQVLSFLAPSAQSQSCQLSQSLNAGSSGSTTAVAATTTFTVTATTSGSGATIGFSHNDLVSRTSWNNNEQVVNYFMISTYPYLSIYVFIYINFMIYYLIINYQVYSFCFYVLFNFRVFF